MVKIIRSRHFSRENTIDVMEVPFDVLPTLAALVFVHGQELHSITSTYAPSTEPDLPDALMDMIQRGFSVNPEKLWDRVHRAKGVILAFDVNGNLVGCTAIRRDQRPYREKIRQSFGMSVDAAYALSWVRARDEFKVREFYELIVTTALAVLETDSPVYVTATGSESRPAYLEALANTGFGLRDAVAGSPLAHLKLYTLLPDAPLTPAAPAGVAQASVSPEAEDAEGCDIEGSPMCEAIAYEAESTEPEQEQEPSIISIEAPATQEECSSNAPEAQDDRW